MEFRILGPLEVTGPEGDVALGGRKQRALLALLLLHAGEAVPSGRLIDLLWADTPPSDAAKALQVHVSRLRRALGSGDVLQTRAGGYLVSADADTFDLPRFESDAAKGRKLLAAGNAAGAQLAFASALSLWRGAPLADLADEAFLQSEIGRLEELYLSVLEDRIDADLALGAHAQLVSELEALVGKHPLRERLRSQLMLALYRSGRQAEALQAYNEARRALVDELGIEPGRGLQELQQSILRQDSSLDQRVDVAATAVRPGRRAAGIFVGRDRELDELTAGLEDAVAGRGRLFLVSGESGVGKTRLADELASHAKDHGARVLWGRCSKHGGAPAFWPWEQAFRSLGEDAPPLDDADGDDARFRSFVATASALRRTAAQQPILIVLEDLHGGDEQSLLLLEFVAGELAEMPVTIVGTYLENAEMPSLLVGLADRTAHHRLRLQPFDADDVARFLELSGMSEADPATVHAETGGNPRLVWQRVR